MDYYFFQAKLNQLAKEARIKLNSKQLKLIRDHLCERDEQAEPEIRKIHKEGINAEPLHGLIEIELKGKTRVVEYERDSELRDTEQAPLLEKGGIEAYLKREMLPYAPDAWYEPHKAKIG